MEFLVFKRVVTEDAKELATYMDMGFDVQRITPVSAHAPTADDNGEGDGEPRRRRRARRRKRVKVTRKLHVQMKALRKQGYIYRVIGRRFGVTEAQAWRIINKYPDVAGRKRAGKRAAEVASSQGVA
jgi:hypothetical protein